jgi:DNA repair exonuclease SbcCD ATPase subunit
MIPKRIKVSGFLSYKDEQEISFDGSALWMLSGLNGSGKSSIFDAVTYALFGHHRGGSQGATDLINKGATGFTVDFEFQLESDSFRIQRSVKRRASSVSSSQQVLKWQNGPGEGQGKWEPVPDTQRKTEFDNWIRDHVGLNYETFTSSILLLQGRAEKLLDSTAKGRAEVLAGIVDLKRYQALHEKADSERKVLRGQVDELQSQLGTMPEVTEDELASVHSRINSAEVRVNLSQREVERLQVLEFSAKQWAELQRRLRAAQERRSKAAKLIQEADSIEKDANRVRELRAALPHVDTVYQRRMDMGRSEESTKIFAQDLRDLVGRQSEIENQIEQIRARKSNLQSRIAQDEKRHQESSKKLPELFGLIERIKQIEQRRDEVSNLERELRALPPDAAQKLNSSQAKVEQLGALKNALSPLSRFADAKDELRRSRDLLGQALELENSLKAKGEEIRAAFNGLKERLDQSRLAVRFAEEKLTTDRALAGQAEQLCEQLEKLDGEKSCLMCGQPLTPVHLKSERSQRAEALKAAKGRVAQAEKDAMAAHDAETSIAAQLQTKELELQQARDEYKDLQHRLQQTKKDVERHGQDCKRAYEELSPAFRNKLGVSEPTDWVAVPYPEPADLDEARKAATELPQAQRELESARTAQEQIRRLTALVNSANEALVKLMATAPNDHAQVRREYSRVEADCKAIAEQLVAARKEDRSAQTEIDGLNSELTRVRDAATELRGKLLNEETTRKLCLQGIATARKSLSPEWQSLADRAALAELNRLRAERDALEAAGAEVRADQLKNARIELESLKQTLVELERERDQAPADARRDPEEIQKEFSRSRGEHSSALETLTAARNDLTMLENRARQRQELRSRHADADASLKRCKILADLLGRDRLQRHLVRQAERQIVDFANGVLDRLSEGTLMLRLVGSDDGAGADEALELEAYNRITGQSPINVAFLSGSQRFRVAVSLALGIGQYASRLHRPIETVIIDEGFGCLDRQGRQVMIQEMHNLRNQLRCILLVSHQEEFADAFSDGYRFEIADGSTRISRLQK